ncbi:YesL family protein [Bacillus thuringiensis]|uniref:YesL family protein n=1 Tax=Bacillus thuringiensis TaxID=1428 RepID=UPI0011A1F7C1|nr:DUF624 domain-containing protein [Bacillus thuringiensis]
MIARIYHLLEWVMKLLFLNLLWIGFTLIGFGVFGLFPSTVAMFQLIMDLINKKDTKMVATFWDSYQSNFKKSNKMGFFIVLIGSILMTDLYFFQMYDTLVSRVLSLMILSMLLFYVVNLLYIIQTFNHFEVKTFHYFKYATFIGIANPIKTILIIITLILMSLLFLIYPGLFFMFGGSGIALVIVLFTKNIFARLKGVAL